MIVSSDYYTTEELVSRLKNELGADFPIETVYRDYHAESLAPEMDVILGDGTCKTFSREDGRPASIYYSAKKLARKTGKSYVSLLGLVGYRNTQSLARRIRRLSVA